jgi:hypothetical protein
MEQRQRRLPVRIFNGVGRLLRRCGWRRPLSADRIWRKACAQAGHGDAGELDVREPLARLVEALERENRLTPLGRRLLHLRFVQLARARLAVQAALRQYPEILDERILRPVFILGLPRTGSTLLHRLLAQDPDSRGLYLWEMMQPAPAPTVDRQRRIRRTRRDLDFGKRYLVPQMQGIHPMDVDAPEECRQLLMNTFRSLAFSQFGNVSAYLGWLHRLGEPHTRRVYEEYRKQLQLLQWQVRPRRWVLKCPLHAYALEALLELFPDAGIVQTHRNLAEVVPSLCSLRQAAYGIYSDGDDPRDLAAGCLQHVKYLLTPALRTRSAHPGRVFDVSYRSLVRDPVAAVGAIHEHFGLRLGSEAEGRMRRWLAANPQGKHGRHRYSLEQFGLDRAAVDALFPGYPECFGLPAEALRC